MNKPVCLSLSVIDLSKTVMYEFCYMDICIDDIYKDTAEDVEARFSTSNYELDRPMYKEKIKKVSGLTKDKLGGKTIK